MSIHKRTILGSAVVPLRMVFLMWLFFFAELYYHYPLSVLGIIPRDPLGLVGVFLAPLLHGNLGHLVSNTFPMIFLGTLLFFFYPRIARKVFYSGYFLTGIVVWIVARPSIHIGASGLIYFLASYLLFFGIFYRNLTSLMISIVVIAIYGTMWYGIFPTDEYISYESHLAGAIIGLVMAWRMRNVSRIA
jgi:membrane associated rhomboid family serine protease